MAKTKRRDLFVPENGAVVCQLCRRAFHRWRGTSSHGLAHVKRGEAACESDPHCPSTSGHRYLFYLKAL